MEGHLHEWGNLLIRWIHFIVGVAWIGASFYFNWLENNLDRDPPQEEGIAGNLWAIHGGGFYHLKKFKVGPDKLPAILHWFKWEAYTTWLSGFALLVVVYYLNARVFLVDPGIADLAPEKAVVLGVIAVIGSWFAYDALCRSPLCHSHWLLSAAVFIYLAALAWGLSSIFSGRAAYIHVGAAIGTMMVGNVFFVIIPAQKEMVSALSEKRRLDPQYGENGLLRSRHNNYLTLPVLFIMISNHFPGTYGYRWNWIVLLLISIAGIVARHYFNVRHLSRSATWLLPLGFLIMVGLVWITAPAKRQTLEQGPAGTAQIAPIIQSRCASCHALSPTQPGFAAAPAGLILESAEQIEVNADRIYNATVVTKIMPVGNLTGMTDAERDLVAAWHGALAKQAKRQPEGAE